MICYWGFNEMQKRKIGLSKHRQARKNSSEMLNLANETFDNMVICIKILIVVKFIF